MHWNTFKQDNYNTVGGDEGCRVGEVRAGTTSPMPDHKDFKPQQLSRSSHSILKWILENLALYKTDSSAQSASRINKNFYFICT